MLNPDPSVRPSEPPFPFTQAAPDHQTQPGGRLEARDIHARNVVVGNQYNSVVPLERKWLQPSRLLLNKPFVGRTEETETLLQELKIAATTEHISYPQTFILQGMGGIGKTYLARKLSIEAYNWFPGGVIFLTLGPTVNDEASTCTLLARLASYVFDGISPSENVSPEQVAAWLTITAPGRFLVVLDDVWHATPLRILNQALPISAIRLITTRDARLAQVVRGNMIPIEHLSLTDGVALLVDRLHLQQPKEGTFRCDLESLVTILDGHALALDIVAAQIRKPSRMRIVLDDLKAGVGKGKLQSLVLASSQERDDNVERTLALSYERMDSSQQRCFRWLGTFAMAAPMTNAALASVWQLPQKMADRVLLDLVDLALLTEVDSADNTEPFYIQHGLLYTYTQALLEQAGEISVASMFHAEYYDRLSDICESNQVLDWQFPNLLVAIEWLVEHRPDLSLSLVTALGAFLLNRGQLPLLRQVLPRAIVLALENKNGIQQAMLLYLLGILEHQLGNLHAAYQYYTQALQRFHERKHLRGEIDMLTRLASIERRLGKVDEAQQHLMALLALIQESDDKSQEADVLLELGMLERHKGNVATARLHYTAAILLFRTQHSRYGEAQTFQALGALDLQEEKRETARSDFTAALFLYREEGFRLGEAYALRSLGKLAHIEDQPIQARQYYNDALSIFREIGDTQNEADFQQHQANLEQQD